MSRTTDKRWIVPERGNRLAMRFALSLVRKVGRRRLEWLLWPVSLYFFVFNPSARRASRAYLQRVLRGRYPAGAVLRHMHSFAHVVLDRMFFLQDSTHMPPVRVEGREQLVQTLAAGQGCLLLGAHIGSFEAFRALGREHTIPLRMLMYRSNLGGATHALETLDPAYAGLIIPIGEVDTMLRVAESLGKGEIVGILGDRTPDTGRCVPARMLGGGCQYSRRAFSAGFGHGGSYCACERHTGGRRCL